MQQKWANPLMGWTSGKDTLGSQVFHHLTFDSPYVPPTFAWMEFGVTVPWLPRHQEDDVHHACMHRFRMHAREVSGLIYGHL